MSKFRIKGTAGELVNASFPLTGTLIIGRADDCDIRIDHADVAAKHCQLQLINEESLVLEHLSDQGETFVNGSAVSRAELASGDEIRISTTRFLVQAPGLRPARVLTQEATRERKRPWLWVIPVVIGAGAWWAWSSGWIDSLIQ